MAFRKFGRGDDQQVEVDRADDQGVKKTASTDKPWTEKDAAELARENQDRNLSE
jgi:hypothetical protein